MCNPEFTGEACEVDVTCPHDCRSQGFCFNGQCLCNPGYEGQECERTRACEDSCNSHGLCRHDRAALCLAAKTSSWSTKPLSIA